MKKSFIFLAALLGLAVLSMSCSRTKTYAEYLADEKKAIERFISSNKLVILDELPTNYVFKENEFYKDPNTGVYFNIITRGDVTLNSDGELDDNSKAKTKETIYIRYDGLHLFMSSDTVKYNNIDPIKNPAPSEIQFYGIATLETRSYYSEATPGWTIPLRYVGHNGRVKMIIPFNFGSSYDRQVYQAVYYDEVRYRFETHI